MDSHESNTKGIKPFPASGSYSGSYPAFRGQVEDAAASFASSSHTEYGLLWLVLSNQEWLALPRVWGPYVPLIYPGPRPNGAIAAIIATHVTELAEFKKEVDATATHRMAILRALDEVALQTAQEDDEMWMLEIPVIMARLRTAWGIPSVLDINTAISNCRREFVQSDHMDALFARHTANYRLLAQANQAVPDAIKIANAVEALTPCASYNECMKTFEQRFAPGDPNRTFAAFKTTMLAFDRLTPRTTTGTMRYSAAIIPAPPPPGTDARLRAIEAIFGIHDAPGDFDDRLRTLKQQPAYKLLLLRFKAHNATSLLTNKNAIKLVD
jgi:hypothetical protein